MKKWHIGYKLLVVSGIAVLIYIIKATYGDSSITCTEPNMVDAGYRVTVVSDTNTRATLEEESIAGYKDHGTYDCNRKSNDGSDLICEDDSTVDTGYQIQLKNLNDAQKAEVYQINIAGKTKVGDLVCN